MFNLTHAGTAAAAGAALLASKKPHWTLDPAALNLTNAYACVLGQNYGSYTEGLRALGLAGDIGDDTATAHGFAWPMGGYDDETTSRAYIDELESCWLAIARAQKRVPKVPTDG